MSKHNRLNWPLEDTPVSRRRLETEAQIAARTQCCVWPKCGAPVKDVPLCEPHLTVACSIRHKGHDTPDEFVFRYKAPIAEPAPEPEKPAPAMGVVYYLRSGGYIKIGWTSDLAKRMRAYAPDSVLLAVEPGTRKDEHRRHRMFAVHRTHGREWYALVPSLTHHIEQVRSKHGQPDPVTFAAQPVTIPQPRPKQYVQARDYRARRTA